MIGVIVGLVLYGAGYRAGKKSSPKEESPVMSDDDIKKAQKAAKEMKNFYSYDGFDQGE